MWIERTVATIITSELAEGLAVTGRAEPLTTQAATRFTATMERKLDATRTCIFRFVVMGVSCSLGFSLAGIIAPAPH